MIRLGRELRDGATLDCDVVVVGTGAGGGMALHDLALAGLRVIALEEGSYRTSRDFNGLERAMLPLLYQDSAARTTDDGAIAVLQGRGVGGSTVHNTNLCKRAPDPVLDDWVARFGLDGWHPDKLAPDFAAVEAMLHVSQIEPERVNRNNDALARGMAKLGWRGGRLWHNRRGCAGSGQCELGCAFDAKENVLKALLPAALAAGADVLAETRCERVLVEGGAAIGVVARGLVGGRPGPAVTIRARAVALAGSAVGSAALAKVSNLHDPHGLVGGSLHLHPGVAVAGVFDERIEGWSGIPQSVECTEHIDWMPGSPKRVWIVPAFVHPIGLAASLPGFGAAHMKRLRTYGNLAILVAMLHDESSGRITADRGGRPQISYRLGERDRVALGLGMAACTRLLLAAGAREVLVPTAQPISATSERDVAAIEAHRAAPFDPSLTAVHPMGTLPMAADPAHGVTDGEGRWHGLRGLYVADGSVFPTSLGGPPQISIYTVGRRVARTIAADLPRR